MRQPIAPAARPISTIVFQSAHRNAVLSPNRWSCRSIPHSLLGCECGDRMTKVLEMGSPGSVWRDEANQVELGLRPLLPVSPEEERGGRSAFWICVVADL
jgi:hypothetical protein